MANFSLEDARSLSICSISLLLEISLLWASQRDLIALKTVGWFFNVSNEEGLCMSLGSDHLVAHRLSSKRWLSKRGRLQVHSCGIVAVDEPDDLV